MLFSKEIREYHIFLYLLKILKNAEDKKHYIQYDEITERILKNIPIQNKKYVMIQLDLLDKNYMDYFDYWCEKYYRNGFVDSIELLKII